MLNEQDRKIFELFEDSPFKGYFERYIEYKRGKGYKIGWSMVYMMKRINNLMAEFGGDVFTREMADYILTSKMDDDGCVLTKMLTTLRQFSLFLSMYEPGTFIIPAGYWAQNGRKYEHSCSQLTSWYGLRKLQMNTAEHVRTLQSTNSRHIRSSSGCLLGLA